MKYTVIEFNLYFMVHSNVWKFEKIWLSVTFNYYLKTKNVTDGQTDERTDGQTDEQTDGHEDPYIPLTLVERGICIKISLKLKLHMVKISILHCRHCTPYEVNYISRLCLLDILSPIALLPCYCRDPINGMFTCMRGFTISCQPEIFLR